MRVCVELDENGFLPDRFAKYASDEFCVKGTPTRSFPMTFEDVPEGTESIAILFTDPDAVPNCGFAWIHWCAAGIPGSVRELPEDASNLQSFGMVQGKNPTAARIVGETEPLVYCRYTGPQPPSGTHDYLLEVFALDNTPQLEEGFFMNELIRAMRGHVLARAEAWLPARS